MDTRGVLVVHGAFRAKENAVFEGGVETPYFEAAEFRPSGTSGHDGDSTKIHVWEVRQFTNEIENDSEDFVLSFDPEPPEGAGTNRVELPAGTYQIDASAPAFSVDEHQTRLWDATLEETIIEGTSEYASHSGDTQSRSYVKGRFTLDQTTLIELQHRFFTSQASNGFGTDSGFYIDNVYTTMQIWQIS